MQTTVVGTIGLAALCALCSVAYAQQPTLAFSQTAGCPVAQPTSTSIGSTDSAAARADTARPVEATNRGQPDIVLLVGFSADELTFHSQPRASIRLCWGSDSLHIIERRNLPSPVVAGTTYRNVYIAAELRAYLNPECMVQRLGVGSPSAAADSSCATIGITTPSRAPVRPPSGTTPSISRRSQ
jgi:hypothetical protein